MCVSVSGCGVCVGWGVCVCQCLCGVGYMYVGGVGVCVSVCGGGGVCVCVCGGCVCMNILRKRSHLACGFRECSRECSQVGLPCCFDEACERENWPSSWKLGDREKEKGLNSQYPFKGMLPVS